MWSRLKCNLDWGWPGKHSQSAQVDAVDAVQQHQLALLSSSDQRGGPPGCVSIRQGVPLLEEVPRSHILPHTHPHTHTQRQRLSFSVSFSALPERCVYTGFTSACEVNHSYSMNTHMLYIHLEMYGCDWLCAIIQYIHHDSRFKQRDVPSFQVVLDQYICKFLINMVRNLLNFCMWFCKFSGLF